MTILPRISVVIPVRNEAEGIGRCLHAILPQHPHEIIVVDGASEDRTIDVVSGYDVTLTSSSPGRAVQMNHGAGLATGNVLFFLHADCLLPSNGLKQISTSVRAGAEAGSFRHTIDNPGWWFRVIEWGDLLRQRWLRMPYGDQGMFVRKELFERLQGFPNVPLMEDVRLVRRLRHETKLRLLEGPLITSARRWERRGVIRQFLLNQYLLIAERMGVPLPRLAKLYYGKQ